MEAAKLSVSFALMMIGIHNTHKIQPLERTSIFLPTDTTTVESSELKPPPLVVCSFGPFSAQTKVEVPAFTVFPMGRQLIVLSRFILESKSHTFNAGAPVWGLGWCPVYEDDCQSEFTFLLVVFQPLHYLAASAFPSKQHSPEIGKRRNPGNVQIWSLLPSTQRAARGAKPND
ncbi:hypothetical protein PM082_015653 [Marasmius tenuissimus]|nr:hypothetical protein PM082_015653 [Marasmius tenuissimus]